jgi:hypothetical protein
MTISIKPTASGSTIEQDGSTVLSIESDRSVDIDSGTLHVDATNNNVGIGTSSPTSKLQVNGASILGSPATFYVGDDGGSLGAFLNQTAALPIRFNTSGVERMRLDSSGNLTIGPTFAAGTNSVKIAPVGDNVPWYSSRSTTATANHMLFYNPNGIVGSIQTNGSSTSFNTSSDYRLKENVVPMSGSIDRLKQLKPSTWAWKVDGLHGEGFLAHEAQAIVPESVNGTKDAMRTEEYEVTAAVLDNDGNVVTEAVMGTKEVPNYQGIDQSKLVPLLTAALQEAIQRIEALEAK